MNDRATITVSARTGEIVLCLVFAALVGYVMFAASRIPMGSYTLPGPGVFPLALASSVTSSFPTAAAPGSGAAGSR